MAQRRDRKGRFAGSGSSGKSSGRQKFSQTDKGGSISRTKAAEAMFGTGSKQHLAALKRFGR